MKRFGGNLVQNKFGRLKHKAYEYLVRVHPNDAQLLPAYSCRNAQVHWKCVIYVCIFYKCFSLMNDTFHVHLRLNVVEHNCEYKEQPSSVRPS